MILKLKQKSRTKGTLFTEEMTFSANDHYQRNHCVHIVHARNVIYPYMYPHLRLTRITAPALEASMLSHPAGMGILLSHDHLDSGSTNHSIGTSKVNLEGVAGRICFYAMGRF